MKNELLFSILTALCFILPLQVSAQETLHPSGYSVPVFYESSDTSISLGDTLLITRKIVNNESFDLTGLYFSDNLPPDFHVVGESLTLDGSAITYNSGGPLSNQTINGYNTYYWVVDSPDSGENIHHVIRPGDSVILQLQIVSYDIGDYILPFHTTVFYGNTTGIFAESDSLAISVTLSLDVDDDFTADGLPADYLISTAFPNPFNAEVTIQYSGSNLNGKQLQFEIFDILGRRVYDRNFKGNGNQGQINWLTDNSLSSGVYLYKLRTGDKSTTGKVLLVK